MPRFQALVLLLAASLCALPARAQTTYTAAKINFNHPGDFTQEQLEAASGLHAGSTFTEADLGAAAQKLADTGFFDNVGVTLDGLVKSVTVLFDISPIDHAHMLPVGFENFVWLTPDEVRAAVRSRAMLFSGYLPENVQLEDGIAAALAQALAAKGIADAAVAHETIEPTLIHPVRALEFRVSSPRPVIANVKLAGVTSDLVPLVQKSVNDTARHAYNEGLAGDLTADCIVAPLLDAGYVRAALTNVSVTPGEPGQHATPVVVSATLDPGSIYHLAAINFAGAPLLSAADFAATAKLHPGDIASRKALVETLAPLDAAYRRQGYMDVVVSTAPTFDDAAHTVAYTLSVTPGEQYHVQKLTALNLDPAAQSYFDRTFATKAGDLYNPEYVFKFLAGATAGTTPLHAYSAAYKAYADPNTHTVDLVLTFVRGAH